MILYNEEIEIEPESGNESDEYPTGTDFTINEPTMITSRLDKKWEMCLEEYTFCNGNKKKYDMPLTNLKYLEPFKFDEGRTDYPAANFGCDKVMIYNITSNTTPQVDIKLENNPSQVWASEDGGQFYYVFQNGKSDFLGKYNFKNQTKEEKCLNSKLRGSFKLTNDKVIMALESWDSPIELYEFNLSTGEKRQLKFENKGTFDEYYVPKFKTFEFQGGNGDMAERIIRYPFEFDVSKKYLLILYINTEFYENHHIDWEIKGLGYITEKYEFINKDKMLAIGAFYGGYLVNWLNGQQQDIKFKGLVSAWEYFNLASNISYKITEHLYRKSVRLYIGPRRSQKKKLYNISPEKFADKRETPMLVVNTNGNDEVPFLQAIFTIDALERKNLEYELVDTEYAAYYSLGPQSCRFFYREKIIQWIKKISKLLK
ncbi:hypothetical protein BB560_003289 [Smittium megazygosporum]|uniref:Peptidase S9 prolyl oligopeptidase catalytic domain-containing protein n=1 Tax=Smittium megazygosporum TaxID=133381 RepID=A0A2T9ZCH2_9FUNG|nr:hypothetical protein BB560_003289 [Smittium megazygosporum]